MAIYQYGDSQPDISPEAYVADTADVIGNVTLCRESSVWYQSVLRGDNENIGVGERSNIQDGAVLHTDPGYPLRIGKGVTVGHQAMLHGCTIGDGSLIGIQAVILNGAIIGRNCLVAAGAVVTEGKEYPDNSLIVGAPAKVIRELSEKVLSDMRKNAEEYVLRGKEYHGKLKKVR